ncbi:MAG: hypothetical protein GY702_02120 [Desulfobulbaceae bacterium]|nr:hypothetical protein [Desulfobulbaceae bacterium]
MDHFKQTALMQAFRNSTEEQLGRQLDLLVQSMGEQTFCQNAASQLMSLARPEDALPGSLARFAPLVRDGIELFLSCTAYPRLRKVILKQSTLKDNSVPGERLLNLALHFPTLHKLGQVIARNPGLNPKLKKWLIRLEQGDYGTDPDDQVHLIRTQLAGLNSRLQITLSPHIIAEASVATVLPYTWQNPGSSQTNKGVFKVLKPEIEANLREELRILESVVSSLEQNRKRYALEEMKLTNLFQEIRGDLVREVDLTVEQENLNEASRIYDGVAGARIPELAPFCTQTMTSMEYIDGKKITDIKGTKSQRQALARLVFEAIICIPLFAKENLSLFHGDPHAGNIQAVSGSAPNSFDVALLDWTLAGHLSKKQRMHIMELLLGIMKGDSWTIAKIIESMASVPDKNEKMDRGYLAETIKKLLVSEEYVDCDPLKKAFRLLEKMTMEGLIFPSELVLYRKSFFTLEGVLHDISPNFAMGKALERYLATLLLQELPVRCGMWMTPSANKSEYYRTLLSNQSLLELSLHQNITIWQQTMQQSSSLIEAQVKLSTDLFMYITGCRYWLGEKRQ